MTRDQLVAHIGGYICGGNVVKDNVCYGKMVENVFVLTPEGEEAVLAPAEAPTKKTRAKKSAEETAADDLGLDLE